MSSESTVRNALEQLSKAQGYISGLQSAVTKAMTEVTTTSSLQVALPPWSSVTQLIINHDRLVVCLKHKMQEVDELTKTLDVREKQSIFLKELIANNSMQYRQNFLRQEKQIEDLTKEHTLLVKVLQEKDAQFYAAQESSIRELTRLKRANFSLQKYKEGLTPEDDQAWGVRKALSGVLNEIVCTSWIPVLFAVSTHQPTFPRFASGEVVLLGVVSNNRILVFARDNKSRSTTSKVSLPLDCTFEELTQAVTDVHTLVGNK